MKKLKLMTVVGTRPEIIRLSRVIDAVDRSDAITQILVHTGQNYDYELNQLFFEDLEIRKPEFFLNAASKTSTASETIGQILIKIDSLIGEHEPDALLVLGDTNSCLSAIPAKKRKIPIFHMEAGNRCFDQRVPEETNRKIVDHIADINLCYSGIAREYLLQEGLPADRIIKTGSPMYEVLNYYLEKIKASDILTKLGLKENNYFVLSAHREENINNERNFNELMNSLNAIAEKYEFPIIFSTHPRTRQMIEKSNTPMRPEIQFLKPLGFTDYNALQMQAYVTLSDSGTISEESSILNFKALNIREAHERPEAMEEAAVMMVGLHVDRIMQGISQVQNQKNGHSRNFQLVADYLAPNVSEKIVRILLSYTDYVNRNVWKKLN